MKKTVILILLVLLLCLIAGVACAGGISNIQCSQRYDGQVQVTWSDSENAGPYKVIWHAGFWRSDYWTCEEDAYYSTSASLKCLIPGITYEIEVSNAFNSYDTTTYTVPKSTFTDFRGRRLKLSKDTFDLRSEGRYQTFRLELHYSMLSKTRNYFWQCTLNTPEGYTSFVRYNEMFKLEPRYSYYYWDWDLSEWMNNVEKVFGHLPSGKYNFDVFLNGQYYAGAGFYVYSDN